MFESLEMPLYVRFIFAFLIVLGLIGVFVWIVRRFGGERLGATTARGRQPRLAVIDAAAVDGRRRLILIRRDNVEHLLMIGGPTDVVIEPNIVRAAAASRESPAPSRAPATTDTLPRAVPLGDAGTWPLQPEPAPAPRPQRSPAPEEPVQWSVEPELPAPRRQPRPVDPLAGLAAEVARLPELPRAPTPAADLGGPGGFVPREPARLREPVREREPQIEREPVREREPAPEREPIRQRETMREREPVREREPARMREPQPPPPPAVADPDFNPNADQNLADMAQRLEAALRRPAKTNEARLPEPQPRPMTAELDSALQAHPRPAVPPPSEASPMRAEPKPAKSLYDSLEKEMANLLGRPSGKS
jgi:flagellar protein FliO/FliZ